MKKQLNEPQRHVLEWAKKNHTGCKWFALASTGDLAGYELISLNKIIEACDEWPSVEYFTGLNGFKTLSEAKSYLLVRFYHDIDELSDSIREIKSFKARGEK